MNIFNNRGCWGGKSSSATAVATPPDPTPTPIQPSEVSSQVTAKDKLAKQADIRKGLASTIKTSSKGLTGTGPDLAMQTLTGKNVLGG